MRLMHLADLHLGKVVNGFSMLEDQAYILQQILGLLAAGQTDAVLIAGDVYDRAVPPEEAVRLYDGFLTELSARRIPVLVIGGNHDSGERLAFGDKLLAASGVHICGNYEGDLQQVVLEDEHGPLHIHLLPFVKPYGVRRHFPDQEIKNYADALAAVMQRAVIDTSQRNVLVAHQFVLPAKGEPDTSDSEQNQLGGIDQVPAALFERFDYVALGHLHKAQAMGLPHVRYAGSPLKYSFSEAGERNGHSIQKSITWIDLAAKGTVDISQQYLCPRRDLREIKGSFAAVSAPEYIAAQSTQDYLHITLTDEQEVYDAIGRLRVHYPYIMQLDYDNVRSRSVADFSRTAEVETRTPLEMFADFFAEMNGKQPNEAQLDVIETHMRREEGQA